MFPKTVYCSVRELAGEHRFFYNLKVMCVIVLNTVWIDDSLLVSSSTNRPFAINMGDAVFINSSFMHSLAIQFITLLTA